MNERDVNCPYCGNYIGALDYCEICHREIKRELSHMRKYFLIVAVVGLSFLIVLARLTPVHVIEIGKISPTNNYGVVKIIGRIATVPYLTESSLVFTVDDGSGLIDVRMYYPYFKLLKVLPEYGDFVELEGKIFFRGEYYYLIVDSPESVKISRLPPLNLSLISMSSDDYDKVRVIVEGKLTHLTKKESWYGRLYNNTSILLYFPSYIIQLRGYDSIKVGDEVIVTGVLKWYGGVGGSWEIIVSEVIRK